MLKSSLQKEVIFLIAKVNLFGLGGCFCGGSFCVFQVFIVIYFQFLLMCISIMAINEIILLRLKKNKIALALYKIIRCRWLPQADFPVSIAVFCSALYTDTCTLLTTDGERFSSASQRTFMLCRLSICVRRIRRYRHRPALPSYQFKQGHQQLYFGLTQKCHRQDVPYVSFLPLLPV